ncbi:glycosyltransferase family 4 protein [Actinomycetospora aeridis]|uniref:Glycosyltransferase family 4 protein n=1 Tax=Actinomycetospora aeridis TaxID=3129231 RepID=A0ABU8N1N6_9PSEU
MRILHLAFEHPRMPGAGGGSRRTHEIDRRIAAAGHEVTVLTTRYPGAVEDVVDGVRYVPVGPGTGGNRLSRLAGYVLGLPAAVRRHRAGVDVVVEDFFAPFSTMAAPRWTGRPTVGVVQWLHARDKARQYKLPLHLVERAGVRRHHRLVAVSEGTAEKLRGLNPDARVDVVGNGVDRALLEAPTTVGRDVVFVGRLELEGKGLDLLLRAWQRVGAQVGGELLIAGGGPEEARVRRFADELGVTGVRFLGWCDGPEKTALLAGARLVVVPSRHETFGMVAVEALATATPVIAFDIPCLREVVPPGVGWTVPPFDVDALAARLLDAAGDAGRLAAMGARGREFARAYDWDALAQAQLAVFREVASGVPEVTDRIPAPRADVGTAPLAGGSAPSSADLSGTTLVPPANGEGEPRCERSEDTSPQPPAPPS